MLAAVLTVVALAGNVSAQGAGAIAGVARDASGGVLPGVTVEVSSPALIEKVRSVVTDGEGQYKVVDLRPGVYSVTFSLAGFSTFKRDGIALSAGFTATINGDLKVGSLEETITVSGQSPIVDTQNVTLPKVIQMETLQALPNTGTNFAQITPGATRNTDIGGASGGRSGAMHHQRGRARAGVRGRRARLALAVPAPRGRARRPRTSRSVSCVISGHGRPGTELY